jgi:fibronectin-binding autotransporter adhesin
MKPACTNPFAALKPSVFTLPSAAYILAFTMLFASQSAQADALTWDTDPADGATITAGSGDWNTTAGNAVWNNAGANVIWSQTSTIVPLNSAIFAGADADADTYVVTLGAQMAAGGLTFNNTGYRLEGTSGLYFPANTIIEIANGKVATIACPVLGPNNPSNWLARLGSTLNITGTTTGPSQPQFIGEGGAGATGIFNFSGTHTFSVLTLNAPVKITAGTFKAGTSFFIGRGGRAAANGVSSSTGTVTLDGTDAVLEHNGGGSGNNTMLGRDGGTGILVIRDGAFNTATSNNTHDLAIPQDNNAASKGTFDVQGGTVTIGSTTNNTAKINFGRVGLAATQVATMIQSGGTITSYGGVLFGGATAATYTGTAVWTMTGGTIYLGAGGISEGTQSAAEIITLSGGSVGAIENWTGSLPMVLDTINGDVTFKCADADDNASDIILTQALTGAGGLKKTGSGKLTLSGVNDYSGTTLVSDGTLSLVTGATPSINGPLTLNGSAGAPIVSMTVSNSNQYLQIGKLTCTGGTTTTDFQFGVIPPSMTVAPVEVVGDVDFTATPLVVVGGTAIANGTYPLIHYSGSLVGTVPTAASLPGYITGSSITHNPGTKTISLVVTASSFNPALSWRVGDGVWDVNATANWTQQGAAVKFNNGNAVTLDDTSSGTSPITITLNSSVSPSGVTVNSTKDYTVTGSGSITGAASMNLLGAGTLTLNGANTYSGGTTIGAGQLNINNGGTLSNSSIGTGPLTINAGTLDNTGSGDVTLQPVIPQTWNGNFSYLGSAHDLNMGTGPVTLAGNLSISVADNTLTVGGVIDGAFALAKVGNGTLSLTAANTFTGGFTLSAGGLNVADPESVGTGTLRLEGGTIDNISGDELTLSPSSILLGSSFTFAGSNNLTLSGPAGLQTPNTPSAIIVTNNTLTLTGTVTLANSVVTKSGMGTLSYSGNSSNTGGMVIQEGSVNLDKSSGTVITNANGVTVQAAGSLVITGDGGDQIAHDQATITPVILNGGSFDLNGFSEKVDTLAINDGLLRNSAAGSTSTLSLRTDRAVTLTTSGTIEVTEADGVMIISAPIAGTGALLKTGAGTLGLPAANTYSGDTTISQGTLTLSNANTANEASTVTIAAGAVLDMVYAGTDTVDKLFFGAAQQPMGEYSASSVPAGATITTANFAGSGTLTVTSSLSAGYASWASLNGAGTNLSDDHDNDGVANGIEYFLGGTTLPEANTTGFTPLPTVVKALDGKLSVTWIKAASYPGDFDTDFFVETSETLAAGSWTAATPGALGEPGMVHIIGNNVTYTFPAGTKKFARLKVTGP